MSSTTEKGQWNNSFPYETEQLKVSSSELKVRINVLSGQQDEFFVCLSPSLNVSGYGSTKKEAQISFEENIKIFILDFLKLPVASRTKELRKMGWKQQKIFKKQFSKAFVDQDGVLQNLKNPHITSLETAV